MNPVGRVVSWNATDNSLTPLRYPIHRPPDRPQAQRCGLSDLGAGLFQGRERYVPASPLASFDLAQRCQHR